MSVCLSSVIPVTWTVSSILTVISQVADTPFAAIAVMVAVPEDTAVTSPEPSTVAQLGLLDFQSTVFSVASSGDRDAVNCKVSPFSVSDAVAWFNVTRSTWIAGSSISIRASQVAETLPSSVETVITAFPVLTAVTLPCWSTVAICSLLDVHTRVPFAPAG